MRVSSRTTRRLGYILSKVRTVRGFGPCLGCGPAFYSLPLQCGLAASSTGICSVDLTICARYGPCVYFLRLSLGSSVGGVVHLLEWDL